MCRSLCLSLENNNPEAALNLTAITVTLYQVSTVLHWRHQQDRTSEEQSTLAQKKKSEKKREHDVLCFPRKRTYAEGVEVWFNAHTEREKKAKREHDVLCFQRKRIYVEGVDVWVIAHTE